MTDRALDEVVVYTDGASHGNPGPAGAGWVITTREGEEIEAGALPLGETTNNAAEYRAVIAALERAQALGARRVRLRADSELLIHQLTGRYQVRSERLLPLYETIQRLCRSFDAVAFEHVPREENRRADELAGRGAGGERVMTAAPAGDGPEAVEHVTYLRVRYGETDQMRFAYYAHYLDWFTEARTEAMRSAGVPYRELEERGIFLPVREAYCEYLRPVRYDDLLEIRTRITRLTPVRLDYAYRLRVVDADAPTTGDSTGERGRTRESGRGAGSISAHGWTRHVFMDANGRPFNLRKRYPDIWRRIQLVAARCGAQESDAS